MKPSLFDRALFTKTLIAALVLVVVGLGIALAVYGEVSTVDVVGASVSGLVLAYLIHLWLMPLDR